MMMMIRDVFKYLVAKRVMFLKFLKLKIMLIFLLLLGWLGVQLYEVVFMSLCTLGWGCGVFFAIKMTKIGVIQLLRFLTFKIKQLLGFKTNRVIFDIRFFLLFLVILLGLIYFLYVLYFQTMLSFFIYWIDYVFFVLLFDFNVIDYPSSYLFNVYMYLYRLYFDLMYFIFLYGAFIKMPTFFLSFDYLDIFFSWYSWVACNFIGFYFSKILLFFNFVIAFFFLLLSDFFSFFYIDKLVFLVVQVFNIPFILLIFFLFLSCFFVFLLYFKIDIKFLVNEFGEWLLNNSINMFFERSVYEVVFFYLDHIWLDLDRFMRKLFVWEERFINDLSGSYIRYLFSGINEKKDVNLVSQVYELPSQFDLFVCLYKLYFVKLVNLIVLYKSFSSRCVNVNSNFVTFDLINLKDLYELKVRFYLISSTVYCRDKFGKFKMLVDFNYVYTKISFFDVGFYKIYFSKLSFFLSDYRLFYLILDKLGKFENSVFIDWTLKYLVGYFSLSYTTVIRYYTALLIFKINNRFINVIKSRAVLESRINNSGLDLKSENVSSTLGRLVCNDLLSFNITDKLLKIKSDPIISFLYGHFFFSKKNFVLYYNNRFFDYYVVLLFKHFYSFDFFTKVIFYETLLMYDVTSSKSAFVSVDASSSSFRSLSTSPLMSSLLSLDRFVLDSTMLYNKIMKSYITYDEFVNSQNILGFRFSGFNSSLLYYDNRLLDDLKSGKLVFSIKKRNFLDTTTRLFLVKDIYKYKKSNESFIFHSFPEMQVGGLFNRKAIYSSPSRVYLALNNASSFLISKVIEMFLRFGDDFGHHIPSFFYNTIKYGPMFYDNYTSRTLKNSVFFKFHLSELARASILSRFSGPAYSLKTYWWWNKLHGDSFYLEKSKYAIPSNDVQLFTYNDVRLKRLYSNLNNYKKYKNFAYSVKQPSKIFMKLYKKRFIDLAMKYRYTDSVSSDDDLAFENLYNQRLFFYTYLNLYEFVFNVQYFEYSYNFINKYTVHFLFDVVQYYALNVNHLLYNVSDTARFILYDNMVGEMTSIWDIYFSYLYENPSDLFNSNSLYVVNKYKYVFKNLNMRKGASYLETKGHLVNAFSIGDYAWFREIYEESLFNNIITDQINNRYLLVEELSSNVNMVNYVVKNTKINDYLKWYFGSSSFVMSKYTLEQHRFGLAFKNVVNNSNELFNMNSYMRNELPEWSDNRFFYQTRRDPLGEIHPYVQYPIRWSNRPAISDHIALSSHSHLNSLYYLGADSRNVFPEMSYYDMRTQNVFTYGYSVNGIDNLIYNPSKVLNSSEDIDRFSYYTQSSLRDSEHRFFNIHFLPTKHEESLYSMVDQHLFNVFEYSGLVRNYNYKSLDFFMLNLYFDYFTYIIKANTLQYILVSEYDLLLSRNYILGPYSAEPLNFEMSPVNIKGVKYRRLNIIKDFLKTKFYLYGFWIFSYLETYDRELDSKFLTFRLYSYEYKWYYGYIIYYYMTCFYIIYKSIWALRLVKYSVPEYQPVHPFNEFVERIYKYGDLFDFLDEMRDPNVDYLDRHHAEIYATRSFYEDIMLETDAYELFFDQEYRVTSWVLESFGVNGYLADVDNRYFMREGDFSFLFFLDSSNSKFVEFYLYLYFVRDAILVLFIRFLNYLLTDGIFFVFSFIRNIFFCLFVCIEFVLFVFFSCLNLLCLCLYKLVLDLILLSQKFVGLILNYLELCGFFEKLLFFFKLYLFPFELIRFVCVSVYNIILVRLVVPLISYHSELFRIGNGLYLFFYHSVRLFIFLVIKFFFLYVLFIVLFDNYDLIIYWLEFTFPIVLDYRSVFYLYMICIFLLLIFFLHPSKLSGLLWSMRYYFFGMVCFIWLFADSLNSTDILFSYYWNRFAYQYSQIMYGPMFFYKFLHPMHDEDTWSHLNRIQIQYAGLLFPHMYDQFRDYLADYKNVYDYFERLTLFIVKPYIKIISVYSGSLSKLFVRSPFIHDFFGVDLGRISFFLYNKIRFFLVSGEENLLLYYIYIYPKYVSFFDYYYNLFSINFIIDDKETRLLNIAGSHDVMLFSPLFGLGYHQLPLEMKDVYMRSVFNLLRKDLWGSYKPSYKHLFMFYDRDDDPTVDPAIHFDMRITGYLFDEPMYETEHDIVGVVGDTMSYSFREDDLDEDFIYKGKFGDDRGYIRTWYNKAYELEFRDKLKHQLNKRVLGLEHNRDKKILRAEIDNMYASSSDKLRNRKFMKLKEHIPLMPEQFAKSRVFANRQAYFLTRIPNNYQKQMEYTGIFQLYDEAFYYMPYDSSGVYGDTTDSGTYSLQYPNNHFIDHVREEVDELDNYWNDEPYDHMQPETPEMFYFRYLVPDLGFVGSTHWGKNWDYLSFDLTNQSQDSLVPLGKGIQRSEMTYI